jgi:adenine/guanine phosphoribosyltransferase-like PRPP-binding protein
MNIKHYIAEYPDFPKKWINFKDISPLIADTDAILQWEKITIIDDLLATGGAAWAAAKLVEKLWWVVHSCAFVISLDEEFYL